MHLDRKFVCGLVLSLAAVSVAGCGNTYRPVVSSINPVGPAGQPLKYAVAISSPSATSSGLVTLIDFSGDTIVNTTAINANPFYLILSSSGGQGYTLNGDGTLNSFNVSTSLLSSNVGQTTLRAGANPVSIFPQGTYTYIAQQGTGTVQGSLAEGQSFPPAIQQELPTGTGTTYTVGVNGAARVYALVQGAGGAAGKAAAVETLNNTISATFPVGVNPVYGVMSADSQRAFVLNKGSNTVTVINAQTNALDKFTTATGVANTIPVGVAPVWADFAPTLSEMVVANAGDGVNPGSLTIINIPRCAATSPVGNQVCDPANPLNALGFGQVLATVPVGINPVMVAVLQDGTRAYVANAGNATNPGSISVVNLTTNTVTATIPAGTSTNPNDTLVHGHPGFIAATQGTPTGKVYVTAPDSTDISIIRTDLDVVRTHLSLQGNGVSVRVTQQ